MKRFLLFLILILLLLIGNELSARSKQPVRKLPGIELNMLYSGNGLQSAYIPAIRFSFPERAGLSIGPRFSMNDRGFSGMNAELRIAVMTEDESYCGKFRLSGFLNAQFFSNEQLSNAAIRMENQIHNTREVEPPTNYEALRFSGNELAAGVYGSYRLDFGLFFQARAGIGFYNLRTVTDLPPNMTHELKSITLVAGIGLGWSIHP